MLIEPASVPDFEIIIGIVAPIGTDLDSLCTALTEQLRMFTYEAETIRLSHLLDLAPGKETAAYYAERMDAGDALRAQANSGDALAAVAIAKLLEKRGDSRDQRKAWILRTLKHDEEVELLRAIFGERFVLVGVNQSRHVRAQQLKDKLKGERNRKAPEVTVNELILRDEMDDTTKFGQRVRDTYAKADYFLDLDRQVSDEAGRFVGLLFGEPFLTPTRDEFAMAHAYTASMRSSDPGRQVGAVITTLDGDILAVGSNEVPKFGGGEYWSGDAGDSRDFVKRTDFNKREMMHVLSEMLDTLAEEGYLAEDLLEKSSELRLKSVWDDSKRKLKATRMMSLIEFGRIVHAEMSALMQAARSTVDVRDAVLYTTAFPCHMCMRLIIAAGVQRVVYVDPYPKSMAFDMYEDSISEDPRLPNRIHIDSFNGASWRIYHQVFVEHNRGRTDYGQFEAFEKAGARFLLAGEDPLSRSRVLENQATSALSMRVRLSVGESSNESDIDSIGDGDGRNE